MAVSPHGKRQAPNVRLARAHSRADSRRRGLAATHRALGDGGRWKTMSFDDFKPDEEAGVLGWVLLIFILLVLFGVIGFSINA